MSPAPAPVSGTLSAPEVGTGTARTEEPQFPQSFVRHLIDRRSLSLRPGQEGRAVPTTCVHPTPSTSYTPQQAADTRHRLALEELALTHARGLLGARYADVRPTSLARATAIALSAALGPRDLVLQVAPLHAPAPPGAGGLHLHCAPGPDGQVDHDQVEVFLRHHRPGALLVRTDALVRPPDFARLREAAEDVGALLVVDISSVAGLVTAGLHPNPIDSAHITVTGSTQLENLDSALVLAGADADLSHPHGGATLAHHLNQIGRATCPSPSLDRLAGTANALALLGTGAANGLARRAVDNAGELAMVLGECGRSLIGHTRDTATVLLDTTRDGITASTAVAALGEIGVDVTTAALGGHHDDSLILDTWDLSRRGFNLTEMRQLARALDLLLRSLGADGLDDHTRHRVRASVDRLRLHYPSSQERDQRAAVVR